MITDPELAVLALDSYYRGGDGRLTQAVIQAQAIIDACAALYQREAYQRCEACE